MFIDTHCHLIFDSLKDDLPNILQQAKDSKVDIMINIATKEEQFEQNLALIAPYEHIFQVVGTHPHYTAQDTQTNADNLVALAQREPKIVGIGETGLDYYYEYSPKDVQEFHFRRHIEAARRADLPLIIHTRGAEDDTMRILKEEMQQEPFTAVIHCFTASRNFAEFALDLGCYLSFSGIVTFKSAAEIQEVAKICPKDRMLVETDAPYLAPVPYRGKTNQPAYVHKTAAFLAELRGEDLHDFALQLRQNTYNVFPKIGLYQHKILGR